MGEPGPAFEPAPATRSTADWAPSRAERYSPAALVQNSLYAHGSSGPAAPRGRWRCRTRNARHLACACRCRLALHHRERGRDGSGRCCRSPRPSRGAAGGEPQSLGGAECDPAPGKPDRRGGGRSRPRPLALAGLARLLRGAADGTALRHHLPRFLLHGLAGKTALQRDHDAGRPGHRSLGVHRPTHRRNLCRRARQNQNHPARRGPIRLRSGARGGRAHRRFARCVAGAGGATCIDASGTAHRTEGPSCPSRRPGPGRDRRLLRSGRRLRPEARGLSRPHRAADRGAGGGPHRPARPARATTCRRPTCWPTS